MIPLRKSSFAATALMLAACAGTGEAPDYPMQPVTVVIPYPAGNAADVVGRVVVGKLAQGWSQPVTIENRAGPTTVPGVDAVAKAKTDGHTLLVHSISFAVDAGLYTSLPFDPAKDFVAVAPFARQPFALVTAPSSGVTNVAGLIALAKQKPLRYASLGPTTQIYFVAEQFRRQTGFEATNVSHKSLVDANGALMKGEVAFWFPPVAGAVQPVREGRLVALAVTAAKRSPMLPQVPTMAEAGVPNMESYAWFGLWAPAGVPRAVVNRLARDVERALSAEDVVTSLAKMGAETMKMTPAEFDRFVRDETEASRRFVRALGISPQPYNPPAKP